jgi:hypothetical protein
MTDERLRQIARKVIALQDLTNMTGTITKRTQGEMLQALSSEDLVRVAEFLREERGQTNGIPQTK